MTMVKSILVIDDSAADQLLTQITIEDFDPTITVIQAQDGKEGLDKLASMDSPPDVILLDINMPGMNGHEFLAAYSKRPTGACVVMMLTSSMLEKDKERCMQYDFVKRYIDKPLDAHDLNDIFGDLSRDNFSSEVASA